MPRLDNTNIQPQNLDIDIDPNDPNVIYKMAEAFKQMRSKQTKNEERILELEKIVLE